MFERIKDMETGEYLDERGEDDDRAFGAAREARFVGIALNNDELTQILMSKKDQVYDRMTRQIVFGPNGKPVLDPGSLLDAETGDPDEIKDPIALAN